MYRLLATNNNNFILLDEVLARFVFIKEGRDLAAEDCREILRYASEEGCQLDDLIETLAHRFGIVDHKCSLLEQIGHYSVPISEITEEAFEDLTEESQIIFSDLVDLKLDQAIEMTRLIKNCWKKSEE